jgi:hypothetical protein
LQISRNFSFGAPLVDDSVITDTSYLFSGLNTGISYHWHVCAVNQYGVSLYSNVWHFMYGGSAVNEDATAPSTALVQNYPNPFGSATTISFFLANGENAELKISDALGNDIVTLAHGYLPAGAHAMAWDPGALPAGVYWYTLRTTSRSQTGRMLLLK